MAMEVSAQGAEVKIRNRWAPLGLGLITFGIYPLVWYYKVNREMRDYGMAAGDDELARSNPTNSILAVVLGSYLLLIPFVISYMHTVQRVQRIQRMRGAEPLSGWLVLGLTILTLGLAYAVMVQGTLNTVWDEYAGQLSGPKAQEQVN